MIYQTSASVFPNCLLCFTPHVNRFPGCSIHAFIPSYSVICLNFVATKGAVCFCKKSCCYILNSFIFHLESGTIPRQSTTFSNCAITHLTVMLRRRCEEALGKRFTQTNVQNTGIYTHICSRTQTHIFTLPYTDHNGISRLL